MFLAQRQLLIDAKRENLQILANEKALLVNTYLESQKRELKIIASMNVFKEAVLYPNDNAKIKTATNRINELKNIIPGISIMNNKGIVIVAEIDLPGADYGQHPYITENRKNTTFVIYYDSLRKKDYYAVVGPVYDNTDKSKIIGIIAYDLDLDTVSALMKESAESKTKEAYLIDEKGLLLSKSVYIGKGDNNGVLVQEVKSKGADKCLADLKIYQKDGAIEEHKDEISQYINYMGDEVFGAIAHVPDIMGCVIAEVKSGAVLGVSTGDYINNIFSRKEMKNEN
jgi:hypothetical protein